MTWFHHVRPCVAKIHKTSWEPSITAWKARGPTWDTTDVVFDNVVCSRDKIRLVIWDQASRNNSRWTQTFSSSESVRTCVWWQSKRTNFCARGIKQPHTIKATCKLMRRSPWLKKQLTPLTPTQTGLPHFTYLIFWSWTPSKQWVLHSASWKMRWCKIYSNNCIVSDKI